MDVRFALVDVKFVELESRLTEKFTESLADLKGDLMKWMFVYWSTTVISLGGLAVALLRR